MKHKVDITNDTVITISYIQMPHAGIILDKGSYALSNLIFTVILLNIILNFNIGIHSSVTNVISSYFMMAMPL